MNSAASVERRIAAMLAEEGLVHAPEGALADVLTVVDGTSQRRPTWPAPVIAIPRIDGRRRSIVAIAAALLITGIAVAGAMLLRPPDQLKDLSSLVILEHQPYVEGAAPKPVVVLAVGPDGSQRTLMTVQPSQLDGTYSEWYAGLSLDGHLVVPTNTVGGGSAPAVLDLRDPTAHAITPDAEGAFPHFGPDGRLAMSQNDGRVAIFDPLTATTLRINAPTGITLEERDFGPVWTADGGLVVTTGSISSLNENAVGRLDVDDLSTTDSSRPYYSGVGARRVDADGRLLRCDPPTDESCDGSVTLHAVGNGFPIVWTQTDASIRVIDYAWAIDGGIWILTETTGAGPRTVALLHVNAEGQSERVAALSGGADDPDPNSYSQAASFAAFSSDDARIIVAVTGQTPQLWSIDPKAGSSTRLPDGIVAGWLGPTTLSSPRPSVERPTELPDAIRGAWAHDHLLITVRQRSIDIGTHGTIGAATATVTPDGSIQIVETTGECKAMTGTYRLESDGGVLHVETVDDPCPSRSTLLEGTYDRALGHSDTGGVALTPGATYLATDFITPFRVTIPTGRAAYVESNERDFLNILATFGSGSDSAMVTFIYSEGGLQPCGESPTGKATVYPDWVPDYLASLIEVDFQQAGGIDVGTEPVGLLRAVPLAKGCEQSASFRTANSFHSIPIQPSTPIGVIERDSVNVVMLLYMDPGSAEQDGWLRELLGSIEWVQ